MAHIPIPQNSVVNLYSGVKITAGQQIAFPSQSSQYAYFQRHLYKQFTNQQYTRHSGEVVLNCSTADAHNANYLSFNNPNFEAKPFYCRITDWEYVNNETTRIFYAIDYYQTYMFDVSYGSAMIEREHMTETSYQAAIEDPWGTSDPYMFTEEPLATGLSVEAVYKGADEWFTMPYQTVPGGDPDPQYVATTGDYSDYARYEQENGNAVGIPGNFETVMVLLGGAYDYQTDDFLKGLVDAVRSSLNSIDNIKDWPVIASSVNFANGFGGAVSAICWPLTNITQLSANVFSKGVNALTDYLSSKNATSSVIGIYLVPLWLTRLSLPNNEVTNSDGIVTITDFKPLGAVNIPKPDVLSGVHPKLNMMPFRYLRIMTPDGEAKEFYVEYFKGGDIRFQLQTACWGIPVMSLIPIDYKYTQTVGTFGSDRIYDERIEFSAFPQLGFASDQYLSYVGSQYQNLLASNTRSAQMEAKSGLNAISNIMNAAGDYARVYGDFLSNPLEFLGGEYDISESLGSQRANETLKSLTAAQNSKNMTAKQAGEAYSDVYVSARDAFVVDNYQAGSTQNALMYQYGSGTIGFRGVWVRLRDDVLVNYNNYLKMYGCSAKRLGVPYVCQWTQGGAQPHFEMLTEGMSTYVKTENMHVYGKGADVCNYIEGLFNGGCFFLKGDEI